MTSHDRHNGPDHDDQSDLRRRLEATADLIDAGVPLGEISARAAKTAASVALLMAIEDVTRDAHPGTTRIVRALGTWVASVEARLSEGPRAGTALPRDAEPVVRCPTCETEFPNALTVPGHVCEQTGGVHRTSIPRDATTAALERAGVALAAQAMAGERTPSSDTCKRCSKPARVNGRLRTCPPCSMSWIAPLKREPLAQSAWVPDDGSEDVAFGAQEFRDKGKPPEQTLTERIRELEAKVALWRGRAATAAVDLLEKTANATQAPGERGRDERLAITWLRNIVGIASSGFDCNSSAREFLKHLRSCEADGIERIEFSVAEVLP